MRSTCSHAYLAAVGWVPWIQKMTVWKPEYCSEYPLATQPAAARLACQWQSDRKETFAKLQRKESAPAKEVTRYPSLGE